MSTKKPCRCPYCDGPLESDESICVPCSVRIEYCPDCGKPLPKGAKECPECGSRRPAGKGKKRW